jgi:pyruvate,orthophosphate dikinase
VDRDGVGELMKIAVARGRATRPGIKLGICGEHGGDPASVEFCHEIGLDYVSASPFRLPIARLAAAQAVLKERAARAKAGKGERPARRAKAPARRPARKAARPARKGARGRR